MSAKTLIVKPRDGGFGIRATDGTGVNVEVNVARLHFNLDDFEFEVSDNRKYVLVQILTAPGQSVYPKSVLTYEDTLKNLRLGDTVLVPVGSADMVGKVVDYGRGGWDGYTRAVISRYSLDTPF